VNELKEVLSAKMESRAQKSQTELLQIEEELTEGLENRH
jgi:hypothetical protein